MAPAVGRRTTIRSTCSPGCRGDGLLSARPFRDQGDITPERGRSPTYSVGRRLTSESTDPSAWDVHQLELDAIGVGEEDGVVARHVLGVLARRMEDRPAPRRDVARERVHLRAALRPEGHLAEADTVLRERVARIARVRLLDPEAPAGAQPTDDRGALGLPDPGIAETRHERPVEGAGPAQIVDGQEHMVHPAGPGDRGGGGWATAADRCLAPHRPLP